MNVLKNRVAIKFWTGLLCVPLAALLIGLTCLSGCIFGNGSSSGGSKEKLEISGVTMTYEFSSYWGYSVKISGTAKNSSGKNYSYASVEYSVYDEEGNNLGTAIDNVNNLANGDSWKFDATIIGFTEEKPHSYKLADITVLIDF